MPLCFVKASMICFVTACEPPGLLDQKLIFFAGCTPSKVGPPVAVAAPDGSAEVLTLGPAQAARAIELAETPASARNWRRLVAMELPFGVVRRCYRTAPCVGPATM